jgi:hypothetical protein
MPLTYFPKTWQSWEFPHGIDLKIDVLNGAHLLHDNSFRDEKQKDDYCSDYAGIMAKSCNPAIRGQFVNDNSVCWESLSHSKISRYCKVL